MYPYVAAWMKAPEAPSDLQLLQTITHRFALSSAYLLCVDLYLFSGISDHREEQCLRMELCHKHKSCLNLCMCHLLAHSAFIVTRFQYLCFQIIQQWQEFSSNFPTLQGHAWNLIKPTWKNTPTSASKGLPHIIPILNANRIVIFCMKYLPVEWHNSEDQLERHGLNITFKLQMKITKGYRLSDVNICFWSANFYEGEAIPLNTQIATKIHGILLRYRTSSIYLTVSLD